MPKAKNESIDLGLAVLAAVNRHGEALGFADIAEVCGVGRGTIQAIARRAETRELLALTFRNYDPARITTQRLA